LGENAKELIFSEHSNKLLMQKLVDFYHRIGSAE
jgi:hypothetical protein